MDKVATDGEWPDEPNTGGYTDRSRVKQNKRLETVAMETTFLSC